MGWYGSPGLFSIWWIEQMMKTISVANCEAQCPEFQFCQTFITYQWNHLHFGTSSKVLSLTWYMLKFEVSEFPHKFFNNLPFAFLLANFVRTKMIAVIQICRLARGSQISSISSLPSDRCLVWRLNIDWLPIARLLTIVVQTVGTWSLHDPYLLLFESPAILEFGWFGHYSLALRTCSSVSPLRPVPRHVKLLVRVWQDLNTVKSAVHLIIHLTPAFCHAHAALSI